MSCVATSVLLRQKLLKAGAMAFAVATGLAGGIAGTVGSAHATTWDAGSALTVISSNPNGEWAYGWTSTLNGPLNAYPNPFSNTSGYGWTDLGIMLLGAPNVFKFNDGTFSSHPGPGGEFSVIRWTSPIAGHVGVTGSFGAGDVGRMSYYVAVNGGTTLSWLNDAGAESFTFGINVGVGDTIAFIVGVGNGGFWNGMTPIVATISSDSVVPLPAALPLFMTGAGLIGLVGWRRQRKSRAATA